MLRRLGSVEYDLDITEPTFSVKGRYVARREGSVRIDIFSGGERIFSEGWDDSGGWQLPRSDSTPMPISDAGAAPLRHGLEQPGHLWTLHDMVSNGHSLQLLHSPEPSVQGTSLVQLTLGDGFVVWYTIDDSTCHVIAKRDFRAYHPDVDPEKRWNESRFDDFRETDGITRPWTTYDVDLASGDTIGHTRLLSVRNVIDP